MSHVSVSERDKFYHCGDDCTCNDRVDTCKDLFRQIMEDYRRQVQQRDREHEYDRAMEILEPNKKTTSQYIGLPPDKQDSTFIFAPFVPLDLE